MTILRLCSDVFTIFMTLAAAIGISIVSDVIPSTEAFSVPHPATNIARSFLSRTTRISSLSSSSSPQDTAEIPSFPRPSDGISIDHEEPDDAIIHIAPKAMSRLRELKSKQEESGSLVLRMGVRNGGCSGLSYAMDFSNEDDIGEDDVFDEYEDEGIKCVVDSKSMLYLFGLELDYSEDLIGGGFKFFNPNAEESCGCGSSFGV